MKKLIIASALLCSFLFVPVFASAQTAPTQDAVTQQLIKVLTQLIAQLQQEIAAILAQHIATPTQTPTSCTPNWQCTAWNTCANSQQTRTCSDSNNCNNNNEEPSLTQYCSTSTPTPVCNPNWQCGDWGACILNSVQTRTCNDTNNCGVTTGKPNLIQSCTSSTPSVSTVPPVIPPTQPASPVTPTPAQQTQLCQNQYDTAYSTLNTNEQQTENLLNSEIASDNQTINRLGANGAAYSSWMQGARQNLANAQASLASAKAQYQASLDVLKNTLQTCLSSAGQNP